MVPRVMSEQHITLARWPKRCRRSMACSSAARFHHGSTINTVSAAVRLSPTPPVFSVISSTRQEGSVWNRSTTLRRSVVEPVITA